LKVIKAIIIISSNHCSWSSGFFLGFGRKMNKSIKAGLGFV